MIVPTVTTDDVAKLTSFYERYFGAKTIFDCGWYAVVRFGDEGAPELGFTTPHHDFQKPLPPGGLMFSMKVPDVDAEHARLAELGAPELEPPTDKPWGDRSFTLLDPQGVRLYLFHPTTPTEEFKAAAR